MFLGIWGLLPDVLPPFQQARHQRNRIKTAYRRNLHRLSLDDPDEPGEYETLAGFRTHYLADVEEKHFRIESKAEKFHHTYCTIDTPGGITGKFEPNRRRLVNGAEVRSFKIPAKHKEEIREDIQDVIDAIERRNRRSRILQYSIYGILFASVLIVFGLLCLYGFDPRTFLSVL